MIKRVLMSALVAGSFFLPVAHASSNLIVNGDFSFSNVVAGSYAYGNNFTTTVVSANPWEFYSGTGVANSSSAWGGVASSGTVAFLQSFGGFNPNAPAIEQDFTDTSNAYTVSFAAAARPNYGNVTLTVTLDGVTVATLTPTNSTLSSYSYTVSGLTAGNHSLKFAATSPTAYDSAAFIDNVSVTAVPEPETYAMLLAGLGLMAGIARRRKNKSV